MSTTENPKTAETNGAAANPFADYWAKYLEQASAGSKALLDGMQAMADPQQLQQRWMEATSESLDAFMRTPVFLEMLRQNLKTITELKKAQGQTIEDTARHFGVPLASDVHGLFERLNGIEQGILARLDAVEVRLEAIEARLNAVEVGGRPRKTTGGR